MPSIKTVSKNVGRTANTQLVHIITTTSYLAFSPSSPLNKCKLINLDKHNSKQLSIITNTIDRHHHLNQKFRGALTVSRGTSANPNILTVFPENITNLRIR